MNRTSARCVIAHSERLNRVMARPPDFFLGASQLGSTLIDRTNLLTRVELLNAECDDAFAVAHPGDDERRVPGEGRHPHRPQLELTRPDHVDRRASPAIEDCGERKP